MAAPTRLQISGFRIIAPIGVGASSTVYRAVDEGTGREVALKVLADNHSLLPDRRQRFLAEVELLDAIDSRAVARIHGLGETPGGQLYMVLDLADRGDLRHRLDELHAAGRNPGRADLLMLGRHLADALTALHQAGIVHRDVSPGNILIRSDRLDASPPTPSAGPEPPPADLTLLEPDERFLLADLGFAKDLVFASGLTAGGGTRGFAAPEQRAEVTVVDERADVYGATAVIEWTARGAGLDDELDPFLDRGLAAEPAHRPATMADWYRDLEWALAATPPLAAAGPPSPWVALTGTGPGAIEPGPGGRWRRLTHWRGAGVMAGTVVLVLGLWLAGLPVGRALIGDDRPTARPGTAEADARAATGSTDGSAATGEPSATDPAAPVPHPTPAAATVDTAAGSGGRGTPDRSGPDPTVPGTPASDPSGPGATAPASGGTSLLTVIPSATDPLGPAAASTTSPPVTPGPTHRPTTTDPRFLASARAYIRFPDDGGTATGALTVSGDAVGPAGGVSGVYVAIHNLDTGLYWHDDTAAYAQDYVRFTVPVTPPGASPVTWTYTIPAGKVAPGRYNVRVWARSPTGNDPVSDEAFVTVTAG